MIIPPAPCGSPNRPASQRVRCSSISAGAGAEPVAAEVRVQPGGKQLCRRARHRAGADDVREERRVADVQRLLERQLAQVSNEVVDRHRLLRHRQRDGGRDRGGRELAVDRQLRQALQQLRPEVDHARGEVVRVGRAPGEVGDGGGRARHLRTLTGVGAPAATCG
jgi:hypothetical protein